MPPGPYQQTLGFILNDVARLMRKRFDERARHLGLTRAQWQVLSYLARNEGVQQGLLADILEVTPITLARILDRLEAADLVERRSHPKDRRIWRLFLRPKTHRLLAEMFKLGEATRDEALAGLPERDRDELTRILIAMKSNQVEASAEATAERTAAHG